MTTALAVDILNEVQERAFIVCLEFGQALAAAMLSSDGSTFGDTLPDRGQRLARFMQDASDGTLDILKQQSPRIYQRYVREFTHDMRDALHAAHALQAA